jgi:hypothetical protein
VEKLGKIDHGLSKVPWLESSSDISVNRRTASFGKLGRTWLGDDEELREARPDVLGGETELPEARRAGT